MKAKRKFNIWLWVLLCVPCLLASCDHDVHRFCKLINCIILLSRDKYTNNQNGMK